MRENCDVHNSSRCSRYTVSAASPEPVFVLDQRGRKSVSAYIYRPGLVEGRRSAVFAKFVCRLVDVRKLLSERTERVVGDRNQFDPVGKLNDAIPVAVSLAYFFRERETATVVAATRRT